MPFRWLDVSTLGFPLLIMYGLVVDPTGHHGLPCLWRLVWGVPCPACGLSRADALLVRGHVLEAVRLNWLIVPVVIAFGMRFLETVINALLMRR